MSNYKKRDLEEKQKQIDLWKKMVEEIFSKKPNDVVEILDKNQILNTLNKIGKSEVFNHTFMPSGGGLDLTGAKESIEKNKIELKFDGIVQIVKPETLTFHPIGQSPEWWYFRLNTSSFESSGVYEEDKKTELFKTSNTKESELLMNFYGEEVLEIEPGEYIDRSFLDSNYMGYDENGCEIPIPQTARTVLRKYNGGAFIIFPKFSTYNNASSTYDARHNKMTDKDFHNYIKNIVCDN